MDEETRPIVDWTAPVEFEPVFNLGTTLEESFSRFNQVERICRKLPGLDCGSCGAPTCKALAEDIVRGEAREQDCIYFFRDSLQKLSGEVTAAADYLAGPGRNRKEAIHILQDCMVRLADEMTRMAAPEGPGETERGRTEGAVRTERGQMEGAVGTERGRTEEAPEGAVKTECGRAEAEPEAERFGRQTD